MSNLGRIVDGEASESESDVEFEGKPVIQSPSTSVKPFVIPGEAPESDDEKELNNSRSHKQDNRAVNTSDIGSSRVKFKTESLLHQKLCESNMKLHEALKNVLPCQDMIKKITECNNLLLHDQENFRSTTSNLSLALVKLVEIRENLEKLKINPPFHNVKTS